MTGAAALPRSNGELVFEEPWHARAFGLAVGLVRHRGLDWDDFRARLVEEISAWEHANPDASGDAYEYYARWLAALERLLLETGLVSEAELRHEIEHIEAEDHHHHPHDQD
jgi:nitrile hydratase accessory protein